MSSSGSKADLVLSPAAASEYWPEDIAHLTAVVRPPIRRPDEVRRLLVDLRRLERRLEQALLVN